MAEDASRQCTLATRGGFGLDLEVASNTIGQKKSRNNALNLLYQNRLLINGIFVPGVSCEEDAGLQALYRRRCLGEVCWHSRPPGQTLFVSKPLFFSSRASRAICIQLCHLASQCPDNVTTWAIALLCQHFVYPPNCLQNISASHQVP